MKVKVFKDTVLHGEYFVQVRHIRKYKTVGGGLWVVSEKGGETVIAVNRVNKPGLSRIYNSTCHPNDTYHKKYGIIYCFQDFVLDCVGKDQIIVEYGFNVEGDTLIVSTKPTTLNPFEVLSNYYHQDEGKTVLTHLIRYGNIISSLDTYIPEEEYDKLKEKEHEI